ncbi:DNA polymerase III subunit alpha [Thiotrichales bacterium HSG1]|nr:DNA polymerase III subunit alpha [Thiotrichales bacterium HSG1]
MPNFIHLHLHTEYSLSDSLIRIKPLVKSVYKSGMPACAITDQNNLFGLVKFYRATQAIGIKPIIGVDVWIQDSETSRLVLLCQNDIGYKNLTRLVSRSFTEGQTDSIPHLHKDWLEGNTDGLIALSGGREGKIGKLLLAGQDAKQQLEQCNALFPQRFYLELQRTGRPNEEEYIHAAIELALATNTPVVATNDVRFLTSDDYEAHELRVCIHAGKVVADPNRPKNYSPQQYLRTPQEMVELFADIPEAIENTELIAKRCNLNLTLGKNFLPDFPIPEGQTIEEYFRQKSRIGLEQRLAFLFDKTDESFVELRKPYDERLAIELDVILQMGFPGYFLIVADFIQWAKDNDVPVGPGRGSGAGSLVAYVLNITDLDPIRYELLFERFLNPERVSMPDFDIDFCMEGRDEVINYVAEHYGREKVSQIITYGTMAAKAVVRDVGRVLAHPHGFVDKIAKLIPFEIGITLEKALDKEPLLRSRYEQEEEVRALIDKARQLEGLTRNVGTHAGGVVISPTKLTDFTPLYCEQDSQDLVSQFDKNDVEAVGLVKFDFLGLRTLTVIKWALQTINHFLETPIDILKIPLDDAATYDLLKRGNTTAVFQLESGGLKKLIRRFQPDTFEDIVALVALYRPGPLQSGMVDDFVERKHGRARIEYPHPDLAQILKPTYGVIVYQEQVMQIAQILAGYSLGGADLLRRYMGKKDPQQMAKQRSVFTEGAIKHKVPEAKATYIFDLMEKFAEYGFNRSVGSNTKIYTTDGIKLIKDCKAGDKVISRTSMGESVYTNIIALHNHGEVPLWEIKFNDNTIECCTLDHKWLTETGQQPLWKIIQMGSRVWGCVANITDNERLLDNITYKAQNSTTILVINPKFDTEVQEQIWNTYFSQSQPTVEYHQQWNMGKDTVLRQPIRATFMGWGQSYDLEVDHPEHNFLLASGLCCSNSHSAAYALVSYQTAWLKAHYPAAFMAAVLSAEMDNTDKLVPLVEECRSSMKLQILPPHVNVSKYKFTVIDDQNKAIRYGLGAIKGAGEAALESIVTERKEGEFTDLFDFCRRIDLRKASRRVLEPLIKCGALDDLGPNRATMLASLETAIKSAERHSKDRATGQNDIFAASPKTEVKKETPFAKNIQEWKQTQFLNAEKDSLGFYLSGHPIEPYLFELSQLTRNRLANIKLTGNKQSMRIAGLVTELRINRDKRGRQIAFVTLDDSTARMDVKIYSELYGTVRDILMKDTLLVAEGEVQIDNYNGGYAMTGRNITTFETARENHASRVEINIIAEQTKDKEFAPKLVTILNEHRKGRCLVVIDYKYSETKVELVLGNEWRVKPSSKLLEQLQELVGDGKVKVIY